MSPDDPLEAYLDRLLVTLSETPREVRRTIAEAEAHLYESTAALEAEGQSREDAVREALRRMGPVEAAAEPSRVTLRLTSALRRRVALSALLIGGIGGVAIGIAGGLALIMRALWGPTAIATAFPAGSYDAADCRHWESVYPSAHDCLTAMTAAHAGHFVRITLACALVGIVALALHLRYRVRWTVPGRVGKLFELELLLGASLAAAVTVALIVRGMNALLVTHADGAGQPFSLAAGALMATLFFATRARRCGVTASLRPRPRPRRLA